MATSTTLIAPFGGSGGVLKRQIFLTSGTFVPSAYLLANGGIVKVTMIGAGGAAPTATYSHGGGGGEYIEAIIVVTGNVSVIVPQQAVTPASQTTGASGGSAQFGSLVARGGNGATASGGGKSGNLNPGGGTASPSNKAGGGTFGDAKASSSDSWAVPGAGYPANGWGRGGAESNTSPYAKHTSGSYGCGGAYGATGVMDGAAQQGIVIIEWMDEK